MEIFQAIVFWLFGAVSLALCIYCIFGKSPKHLNIITTAFALSITILIFNLKSPVLALLQALIFGAGGYFILKTFEKLTAKEDKLKKAFVLNAKTALSLVFGTIFAASFIPFVLYVFNSYKTQNPVHAFDFLPVVYKGSSFGLILVFALAVTLTVGLTSIFNVKTLRKKIISKEGEQ